jgi:hypothetical protein
MNRAPTLLDRDGTKSAQRGGICNKTAGNRQEAMEDSLHFDIPVQQRMRPFRRVRAPRRAAERPELLSAEPINVYHWAAVALVTALMGVVMACAAGTPALAHAAGFKSAVSGALGGMPVLGGTLRAMRLRRSQHALHSSEVNGGQR